jgi:hypothetical protein
MLQPLDVSVFCPIKHYFRHAVEKQLRTGAEHFPKREFLETYNSTRPLTMTAKNIKSGFLKSGLIPFNRSIVLKQLSHPQSPEPMSPEAQSRLQTPKNLKELENIKKLLDEPGSPLVEAARKVYKAAEAFYAKALILQTDYDDMVEETVKMRTAASRKRKKVPVDGPQAVGTVLDLEKSSSRGGRKCPVGRSRKRQRRSLSPYHVDLEQDEAVGSKNGGIGDCIVAIPHR